MINLPIQQNTNFSLLIFELSVMTINFLSLPQKLYGWVAKGSILLLGIGTATLLGSSQALASEEIILSYSALGQSVSVRDLETFVETGEMSSSIRFLINATKQDPDDVRNALTKEIGLSLTFLSDVLNSLPGEYALFQAGQIIHPKSKPNRALIPSLRGALILSTSDDNKISLLEFFQNYPTQQMYVDARLLKNTSEDIIGFINRVEERFEVPLAIAKSFLEDMICDCEPSLQTNSGVSRELAIQSSELE